MAFAWEKPKSSALVKVSRRSGPKMVRRVPRQMIQASLDAAATTDENVRHWKDADSLSARAAFSPLVRKTVRERSRLEAENNSWYSGILRTAANHIVGTGPRLQVLTSDQAANARIEAAWRAWSDAICLTEKLRIAVETYWRDGEVFFLRRYRHDIRDQVGLEICIYEADQVTNPYDFRVDPRVDDGIRVDEYGREVAVYLLDHHPGDINVPYRSNLSGEWYPATDISHLFRSERPGQLRGIPRITPSLELFPKMRRHTLATLAAAEAVAEWTLFVKTNSSNITPQAMPRDFATVDFTRNMMNFLPDGWDPFQIKPEQPTTNHEMFQRCTLMEICRAMNFPYLLASGTSKDSNFTSAKMDVRNIWEPEVVAEQSRIAAICLSKFFRWFMEDAIFIPGLLDGIPPFAALEKSWHWDQLPVTDEVDAASAAQARLASGQSTHPIEFARRGMDFESTIQRGAEALGVTPEDYRRAIFFATFPAAATAQPAAIQAEAAGAPAMPGAASMLGMRQLDNKSRATRKRLQEFIDGSVSEAMIRVYLRDLGWTDTDVDALVSDAMDGVIDTPELQEVSA